jgi:hypothetical protein
MVFALHDSFSFLYLSLVSRGVIHDSNEPRLFQSEKEHRPML